MNAHTTASAQASAPQESATRGAGAPLTLSATQLLRLAVGASMYAVPIDLVREILKVGHLTELPLMPPFVRGVMNLRGAVVPVIDLGARLGGEPSTLARRTCVVVIEQRASADAPAHVMGMLVDAVHEVVDAREADLEPVPALGTRIAQEFLACMARLRGDVVPVLALERVLDEEALAHSIGQSAHQGLPGAVH